MVSLFRERLKIWHSDFSFQFFLCFGIYFYKWVPQKSKVIYVGKLTLWLAKVQQISKRFIVPWNEIFMQEICLFNIVQNVFLHCFKYFHYWIITTVKRKYSTRFFFPYYLTYGNKGTINVNTFRVWVFRSPLKNLYLIF